MKLTKNAWLLCACRWMGQSSVAKGLAVAGPMVLVLLAVGVLGMVAGAQAVQTTTVQGTVYQANGQAGAGTLDVSWPAFTTAAGQAVAAGRTEVTIARDGFVSVNLTANLGAMPAGLYYTAIYHMSDGTTSTEYWVVPAAAQAALGQVRAQVMPAAQAVQAVSKAYVDQAIAELTQSLLTASGGTLSGPLYLNGDPTQPLQAADKHYVDTSFSKAVPLAGGNMTGALQTPTVNGVQAPAAGSAQTTLQGAMTAAGTSGAMEIPPSYAGTDGFTNPNGVRVTDLRTSGAQQAERSVKEFGAVCDGATDDTNALQTALNYANVHRVALTIPQGICKTQTLNWHGESIGGLGKQVSALMGFPGQDVLATAADSASLLSNTRLHDLTIYLDQSVDVSCSGAVGRAAAGSCGVNRPLESNSIFSQGGNGQTGSVGTGAGWAVGNCAIAMPAVTGAGGNGLKVAQIENLAIVATGTDPMATQYAGAHSTHTCGMYLAQWPQWSEFRNIDIRGLNTGIAIPALAGTAPAGLNADSNRWQNITLQATHGFTAAAGSNNVLDNVVAVVGNSAATGEPPTGLVLDFAGTQQGWTVRNAVVLPAWNAVQPLLTVSAAGGAVTAVTAGLEHGLGFDPYGTQVPLKFSGSCTAAATATVNVDGSIGAVSVTQGGVGCSGTTTASVNVAGTWDTAAVVNLISGQNMSFFAGNLLKGNGGYTVWNAVGSASYGTQLDGGGGVLPGGGSYAALVANSKVGSAYAVDQFPGVDFGAKLQACLNAVSAVYGGTCDARNFAGTLAMAQNLTIATGNTTVELPCATIATANQIVVTAGTRNVALKGCALRGGTATSGSQGGTVLQYSGIGAMVQVGDPTYAVDTQGFHLDNAVISTTAATSAMAQGLAAYRTQEMDLESLYFLGNPNQTGMTLDGTGNYTGGTYFDNAFNGFQTAVHAIGHQVANAATTDWLNASAFVRLHIDCPTSGGSPISGTYGINLVAGDGNTFTGGDVEGCATALHLGANAQNNTIIGLRNENSTSQVVADAGSQFNNWITGGTMFTGKLTDNGTRNSFLDTFHRSFNGMNGDWYGSQQDATVTNHNRLGIGSGNERGLLERYQTDYGYRWTTGLSDAAAGEQYYQVLDELNNVYRLSIGQYNNGQASTNNQTVINAAGTGAVVLNGSNNAGTGGVVFGSGGASETTVATISNAGNAQFNGTLQVAGVSTLAGTPTVKNQANAEIDAILWAGLTASQKEALIYKDWNGNSQWYMVKDTSNNWALNSATGGLDSFKAYQSSNSGDTYINASNGTGVVRVNYETGAGPAFKVYGGSSSTLYASFTGTTSIQFPGLAASSGHNCLQIDNSGYISNTGAGCAVGGGSGTVNSATTGQIAYYTGTGTTVGGMSTVPVTAGGTGSATAAGGLANLGGVSSTSTSAQSLAGALNVSGSVSASNMITSASPYADIRAYGAKCDGTTDDTAAFQSALTALASTGGTILVPGLTSAGGCYLANPTAFSWAGAIAIKVQGNLKLGSTMIMPNYVGILGDGGSGPMAFAGFGPVANVQGPSTSGTLGAAVTAGTAQTFTPSTMAGLHPNTAITVIGQSACAISSISRDSGATFGKPLVTAVLTGACHIAPGYTATIAGVTDTSFNGSFVVGQSDYVLNTVGWLQNGAVASSSSGTVTGPNEDSLETAIITATTTTTATATFVNAHASTDAWGIVALEMTGFNNHYLTNIAVSSSGTAIWGYAGAVASFNGVSAFSLSPTSIPVELNEFARVFMRQVTLGVAAGYGSYSLRLTNTDETVGYGTGDIRIQDSNTTSDIKIDRQAGQQGNVYLSNMIVDTPNRGVIVVDTSSASTIEYLKFDTVLMEDNFFGALPCMVTYLYPNRSGIADIRSDSAAGSSCMASPNYNGILQVNGIYKEGGLTTGGSYENGFSITKGGVTETELRGEGASLSPSIVPYGTLPVPAPSTWSSTGTCGVTTGVTGPDGASTAVTLTGIGGGTTYIKPFSTTIIPAVGDYVLWGGWVRGPANGLAYGSGGIGVAVSSQSFGTTSYLFDQGNQVSLSPSISIYGDWWQPLAGAARISSVTSSGGGAYLQLAVGCQSDGWSIYQPWMIYVPASAGVPLSEIKRWRQQLLHGDVSPSAVAGTVAMLASRKLYWGGDTNIYRGASGVLKTDGTINAVNGYQVNGNALGTSNLADWTNAGAVNGYCPVWNSASSKWVPGICTASGGAVTGPASSVNNDLACWNGTTGTVLSDCGAAPTPGTYDFTTSSAPTGATGSNPWTWTLPANAQTCTIYMIGGGAGGGSGATCTTSSTCYGGGGGTGANMQYMTVPCSYIGGAGATVTVGVGAGGNGGTAQSGTSASGNNGSSGGTSYVGGPSGYAALGSAGQGGQSGSGGSGGTTTTGTGGSMSNVFSLMAVCSGGAGSSGAAGPVACLSANSGPGGGSGGGGLISGTAAVGGAVTGANSQAGRGAGITAGLYSSSSLAGGTTGIPAGQTPTYTTTPLTTMFFTALGGTGGASQCAVNGGKGGDGMFPGGGGAGGGAACNTYSSGAGGKGGNGFVRIIVN